MPRSKNEFDRRPALSNCTSQPQPIHRAWHVYVGKNDADVFSGFQDGDGFIGVGCFYRSEACGFHQIDSMKPTKKLVLND